MEIRVTTDVEKLVFTIPKIKRSKKIIIHKNPTFVSEMVFNNTFGESFIATLVNGFTRKDQIVFIQTQIKDNFHITLNYRFCNRATLFLKKQSIRGKNNE